MKIVFLFTLPCLFSCVYAQNRCSSDEVYDSQTNRCVSREAVREFRRLVQRCRGIQDLQERKECNNATRSQVMEASNITERDQTILGNYNFIIGLNVAAAVPVVLHGGLKCKALSAKVIPGSAAVLGLGHYGNNYLYNKNSEEIVADFKEIVGSIDQQNAKGSDNQVLALKQLKKQQVEYQNRLKSKQVTNLVALTGYSVGLVAAVVEAINPKDEPSKFFCYPRRKVSGKTLNEATSKLQKMGGTKLSDVKNIKFLKRVGTKVCARVADVSECFDLKKFGLRAVRKAVNFVKKKSKTKEERVFNDSFPGNPAILSVEGEPHYVLHPSLNGPLVRNYSQLLLRSLDSTLNLFMPTAIADDGSVQTVAEQLCSKYVENLGEWSQCVDQKAEFMKKMDAAEREAYKSAELERQQTTSRIVNEEIDRKTSSLNGEGRLEDTIQRRTKKDVEDLGDKIDKELTIESDLENIQKAKDQINGGTNDQNPLATGENRVKKVDQEEYFGSSEKADSIKKEGEAFLATPIARALVATGGILTASIRTKHLNDDIKETKSRINKIEEEIQNFTAKGNLAFCSENDREDPSQTLCFCYSRDAQGSVVPNMAKKNVATCLNDFRIRGYIDDNRGPQLGCIRQNFSFDAECSCRSTNSCATASTFFAGSVPDLGGAENLFNGIGIGEGYSQGNMDRMLQYARSNIEKASKELPKIKDPSLRRELTGLVGAADQVFRDPGAFGNGMGRNSMGANAGLDQAINEVQAGNLTKAQEVLEQQAQSIGRMGGDLGSGGYASRSSASDDSLNFSYPGIGASGNETSGGATFEMEGPSTPVYDYSSGDSGLRGSSQGLFEVLSHRYRKSAYPHLVPKK